MVPKNRGDNDSAVKRRSRPRLRSGKIQRRKLADDKNLTPAEFESGGEAVTMVKATLGSRTRLVLPTGRFSNGSCLGPNLILEF